MKLLVIGSDRNLFKKNSDIWNRYLDYGKLFEEIHVIVFSNKNLGNEKIKIGDNVFVYPTNHTCKFFYLRDVYRISKQLIKTIVIPAKAGIQVGDWIPHQVRNDRKVVVSAQDPFESGLAGWMLKKIYKIPLQIQVHTDFLSQYFWEESFMNKLRVLLAKFVISRADGIRVVSERIRKTLVSSAKLLVPISVLPIYVDIDKIQAAPIVTNLHTKYSQFDFIILMASRLTKEKNIGMAIGAMAELVKKSAAWRTKLGLVIVGYGSESENLKLLTLNLKLDENIKFEGWSDDLISYYKTADLFLLTSNYEGYGRSVIEAMAAGLPVVTTDVGLAGEVLINDKNGIIISVGDKKALISAAELLMKDNKRRDLFSSEGKRALENLITKEQYLKLYKEIIGSANYEK